MQEMQPLLKMSPDADRGLLPSSHPRSWSHCLPRANLCRKPVDLAARCVGKAEEGQGMNLRADRPRLSPREWALCFISVNLIPHLESADNGNVYAQAS